MTYQLQTSMGREQRPLGTEQGGLFSSSHLVLSSSSFRVLGQAGELSLAG